MYNMKKKKCKLREISNSFVHAFPMHQVCTITILFIQKTHDIDEIEKRRERKRFLGLGGG